MTEAVESKDDLASPESGSVVHVAPSPHVCDGSLTTRLMMLDVLIALAPVVAVAVYAFGWYAARQIGVCVLSCVAAEMLFAAMRKRRPMNVATDLSALVTGLILAMSLPWSAPWYVAAIGSVAAVGVGKVVFGGLGQNIFNPAMVGRAFVMICFASALGAGAYVARPEDKGEIRVGIEESSKVDVISQATPMTVMKKGETCDLMKLLWGGTNGSLGEVSAVACLIGGLYLCLRRTAAWQIPVGMILSVLVIGGLIDAIRPSDMTVFHHLLGGALLFGAFFIATDPVTSPLTARGRWIFGLGLGAVVMLLRVLSNYPEGVMFAVLLLNAVVPLINRWTIPAPVGGPVPAKK